MSKIALLFAVVLSTVPAFAADHASEYKVGIFSATGQVNDGTYTNAQGNGARTNSASHNIHYVQTDTGMYYIESPAAVGKTILVQMATKQATPEFHKQWFMDQLHEGDKVLFAVKCDKHNNCRFWLPNPEKPGKEIATDGYYRPNVAQTNTQSLCGKGKLTPEVEAQVCPAVSPK